jgi:hypothetical protein
MLQSVVREVGGDSFFAEWQRYQNTARCLEMRTAQGAFKRRPQIAEHFSIADSTGLAWLELGNRLHSWGCQLARLS